MHSSVEAYIYIGRYRASKNIAWCSKTYLIVEPKIEERFGYKVPFYKYHHPLCYLSISKQKVYIGFVKGSLVQDESSLLTQGNRKQIAVIVFDNNATIPYEALRNSLVKSMLLLEEK